MNFKKNKKNKNNRGFVILIAIVVSSLLVSLGVFIANIAYKELTLSTSAKASQKAFFVADSIIECALRYDFRDNGFVINQQDYTNRGGDISSAGVKIRCNNFLFSPESISSQPSSGIGTAQENFGSATSIYYISFAEDTNGDIEISDQESRNQNAPYAKLEVTKNDIGGGEDKTILRAFGHNKYTGVGLVERALEVTY